ncbi:hypothetical protein BVI434_1290021 [Burkholderia vietnamiensis]|nr:hypothetical protein BVI434_1290021 [Burkholderia vietnamiensis]CAG9230681.1 hypothetical protein BVI1335_750014 [Burkholderia vietnamiensis]
MAILHSTWLNETVVLKRLLRGVQFGALRRVCDMLLSAAQSKRLDDFLIVWTESRSFFASESADLVEQSKPSIE